MSLGRVLVEEFQPEVLKWLGERVELVVVNPWVEPERWEIEARRVDAVISRKGKITRKHMERAGGRLKIIARTGVGVDPSRVDLDAAKELKIWVTNQPGSNSVSVAELVFGQIIALARHTHEANRAVKENRWSEYLKFTGTELAGKTLGIVGMGNIGTRVAIRARAFDMEFMVYDPYIPESHVTALGGGWVELGLCKGRYFFSTGYTVDDPNNGHVASGNAILNRSWYVTNQFRIAPSVTAGIDYTFWQTRFKGLNEGTDNRFNLYLMYAF